MHEYIICIRFDYFIFIFFPLALLALIRFAEYILHFLSISETIVTGNELLFPHRDSRYETTQGLSTPFGNISCTNKIDMHSRLQ